MVADMKACPQSRAALARAAGHYTLLQHQIVDLFSQQMRRIVAAEAEAQEHLASMAASAGPQ